MTHGMSIAKLSQVLSVQKKNSTCFSQVFVFLDNFLFSSALTVERCSMHFSYPYTEFIIQQHVIKRKFVKSNFLVDFVSI